MKLLEAPPRMWPPIESGTVAVSAGVREVASARFWADWMELCKARLNSLVLCSVAIGYVCGSAWHGAMQVSGVVWVLVGTAWLAAGAAVLNQYLERHLDAMMERTCRRPLPAGRITPQAALRSGVSLALAGLAVLLVGTNPVAAMLGAATLAIYLGVYTPLKTRTTLNTLVGAVAGALPPLIGWSAAAGRLDSPAWSLYLIQFLWQFPHFWSIAWLYREDYARAGMRMVPVLDTTGRMTGRLIVNHCLVLVAASFTPVLMGLVGPMYLVVAVVLGALFLLAAGWFLLRPEKARARLVLWTSLVYLPVLLITLVLDGAWAVLLAAG